MITAKRERQLRRRRVRTAALIAAAELPGAAQRSAAELCVLAHYIATGQIRDAG